VNGGWFVVSLGGEPTRGFEKQVKKVSTANLFEKMLHSLRLGTQEREQMTHASKGTKGKWRHSSMLELESVGSKVAGS